MKKRVVPAKEIEQNPVKSLRARDYLPYPAESFANMTSEEAAKIRPGFPQTPELDKIRRNKNDSQKLGKFLIWLGENNIVLAERLEGTLHLRALFESTEKLLARYFEIDLEKVEQERQALLAYQRKLNGEDDHA